ncbi:MAG: hypothetical protein NC111_06815 [Bacteroides sp.]|nr:hypothetical protein [Bacteroides sp.]MCM1413764.1 hypothetical protein [Bacteroides sp.]MCM1472217.1 hypothetical protein [Bacteroides sp.]
MADKISIKRSCLFAALTAGVVIYLGIMAFVASSMAGTRKCTGVTIVVHDTAQYRFVTPEELKLELGNLPKRAKSIPLSSINTDSLERALARFDKIESVSVNILSDGRLLIDVVPMKPVARIFDTSGESYYINRSGKRIKADARYHLDVPVITGNFEGDFSPVSLIPLVDYINSDSLLTNFVSMIKVDSPTDIIVVPSIRGHVINLGDTLNYADKFRRVKTMYQRVMNVRGWQLYDTISVKWDDQIVATRRDKTLHEAELVAETTNAEDVDVSTMLSGHDVAPGQSLPNRPVKNEKLIPGRTIPASRLADPPTLTP